MNAFHSTLGHLTGDDYYAQIQGINAAYALSNVNPEDNYGCLNTQHRVALILPIIGANNPSSNNRELVFLTKEFASLSCLFYLIDSKVSSYQTTKQALENRVKELGLSIKKINHVENCPDLNSTDKIYQLFTVFVEKKSLAKSLLRDYSTLSQDSFESLKEIFSKPLSDNKDVVPIDWNTHFEKAYTHYTNYLKSNF